MMSLRNRLRIILGLTLLLMIGWGDTIFAHGGTGMPQLTNEDIGPYRIFVWSDPEPPQVGEYHVAVALTESLPGDASGFAGQPILGADVTVELTHVTSGETLIGQATHKDAINKIYYEADFEVTTPGEWRIELTVDGPDGIASASYVDEIIPASFNWLPIAGGVLAVLLVAGAFVFHWRVQPQAVEAVE
jgi:hypothetical protein